MRLLVRSSVCRFFFQAEDGIRDAQESRGLGDVYKRQVGELPTGAQSGIGSRMLAGSYYGQTIQIWSALVLSLIHI